MTYLFDIVVLTISSKNVTNPVTSCTKVYDERSNVKY